MHRIRGMTRVDIINALRVEMIELAERETDMKRRMRRREWMTWVHRVKPTETDWCHRRQILLNSWGLNRKQSLFLYNRFQLKNAQNYENCQLHFPTRKSDPCPNPGENPCVRNKDSQVLYSTVNTFLSVKIREETEQKFYILNLKTQTGRCRRRIDVASIHHFPLFSSSRFFRVAWDESSKVCLFLWGRSSFLFKLALKNQSEALLFML